MNPTEILEAVTKYGLPLMFLGLIMWKVWPFLERRVEHSEALAKGMLESSQERWVEISKEFVSTIQQERLILEKILREVEEVRLEVRRNKKE